MNIFTSSGIVFCELETHDFQDLMIALVWTVLQMDYPVFLICLPPPPPQNARPQFPSLRFVSRIFHCTFLTFLSLFITSPSVPLLLSSLHSLAGPGLLCSKVENSSRPLSSHSQLHFLPWQSPFLCIVL